LLAFVDTPQRHGGLTVYPVVSADQPDLSYVLVADALRRGLLTFRDGLSEDGPCVTASNSGNLPVLILDCEAMGGLDTKRACDQSVLLGPGSVTQLPTACLNATKWDSEEPSEPAAKSTGAFPLLEDQVGILVFLGRHFLGMDVLGSPELYRHLHKRLLTGYLETAGAAAEGGDLQPSANGEEVQALALALEGAERVAVPCPGHGEYAMLRGTVAGGELRHNGHLVHLSVFPAGAAA